MSTRRTYTAEVKAEVVDRLRGGETAREIGEDTGVPSPNIWAWAHAAGFRRGTVGPAPHPRRQEAVERVAGGEPGSAVARDLGVTPACVCRWVRAVSPPPPPEVVELDLLELMETSGDAYAPAAALACLRRRGYRFGPEPGPSTFTLTDDAILRWIEEKRACTSRESHSST